MARNPSGNYSLPSGNPVVGGTTILAAWANTTMADLGAEVTDSLSRSGKGAMLAPLGIVDGAAVTPGLAFASELTTGLYRAGAGDLRVTVLGVTRLQFTSAFAFTSALAAGDAGADFTFASSATRTAGNSLLVSNNGAAALAHAWATGRITFFAGTTPGLAVGTASVGLTYLSNLAAASGSADHIFNTVATRTAGNLFQVQNAAVAKFSVNTDGDVLVGQGAGTVFADTVWASASNASLLLQGSKNAADAGVDVIVRSANTRTGGYLFAVENNGVEKFKVDFDGGFYLAGAAGATITIRAVAANTALGLRGNKDAADTGVDVAVNSTVTRTAGNLFQVQNNGVAKFRVDFGGAIYPDGSILFTGTAPDILAVASNSGLRLIGNKDAADTGTDVTVNSTVTRTAGNLLSVQNNGSTRFRLTPTGDIALGATGTGGALVAGGTNLGIQVLGNKDAADTGTDVRINSTATRTAGNLLDVQNNSTSKFRVGFDGSIYPQGTIFFGGSTAFVQVSTTNVGLVLIGNKNAADSGTDVIVNGLATRTAGLLLDVQNNGVSKAYVTFAGAIHASATEDGAAAAGANWSLLTNTSKRSAGQMSGYINAQAAAGAAFSSIATIPAGWRPLADVSVAGWVTDSSAGLSYMAVFTVVASTGVVAMFGYDNGTSLVGPFAIGAGDTVSLSFAWPTV